MAVQRLEAPQPRHRRRAAARLLLGGHPAAHRHCPRPRGRIRACSCSTSRPPASTPTRPNCCSRSCATSRRRASPSSSSPTSSTRSTRSPTASRCCATAAWSARRSTADLPRLKLISMMIGRELDRHRARPTVRYVEASGSRISSQAKGLGRKRTIAPFDLTAARRRSRRSCRPARLRPNRDRQADVRRHQGRFRQPDDRRQARRPLNSPRHSLREGIAFCPEDRKADGLVGELSVRENIMLSLQAKRGWFNRLVRKDSRRSSPHDMIQALDIATPDAEKPVGQLSGGNQQKVVLARSLVSQPTSAAARRADARHRCRRPCRNRRPDPAPVLARPGAAGRLFRIR